MKEFQITRICSYDSEEVNVADCWNCKYMTARGCIIENHRESMKQLNTEAPDKIYIPKNLAPHLTEEWASHTHGSLDEYIRKGALIEWLEKGYEWVHNPLISVSNLIDKLNSI